MVRNDTLLPTPVLNLQYKLDYNTERGLQGIVLDPNFAANGYLYVYYTAKFPASHNRLSRFTVVNNVADTAQETVLFELPNLPARASVASINVPGTTDQYPNWRARLPCSVEEAVADVRTRRIAQHLNASGRRDER